MLRAVIRGWEEEETEWRFLCFISFLVFVHSSFGADLMFSSAHIYTGYWFHMRMNLDLLRSVSASSIHRCVSPAHLAFTAITEAPTVAEL